MYQYVLKLTKEIRTYITPLSTQNYYITFWYRSSTCGFWGIIFTRKALNSFNVHIKQFVIIHYCITTQGFVVSDK